MMSNVIYLGDKLAYFVKHDINLRHPFTIIYYRNIFVSSDGAFFTKTASVIPMVTNSDHLLVDMFLFLMRHSLYIN